MAGILARADRAGIRERLRTLPALDLAAAQLRDAVKVLLDPPAGGLAEVWAAIGRTVSREQLAAAVEAVDATTRPATDTHLDDLLTRYSLVRRFLPALLATLRLEAAPGGADVLEAWEALRTLEGRRVVRADEVPLTLATGAWTVRVMGLDGLLNRAALSARSCSVANHARSPGHPLMLGLPPAPGCCQPSRPACTVRCRSRR